MNYQKLLNSNIKALRLKFGLTQEEFAERVGISIQGLSNIERNRYQPTSSTVDKICKSFNLSPVELLFTNSQTNDNIIQNINVLLKKCSTYKLKQIYEIIQILSKTNPNS